MPRNIPLTFWGAGLRIAMRLHAPRAWKEFLAGRMWKAA